MSPSKLVIALFISGQSNILLKGAKSLDEAVAINTIVIGKGNGGGEGYARFFAKKPLFLAADSQEVQPGQLKLEWLCNLSSWKFITMGVQQYVLRDKEEESDCSNCSGHHPMQCQKTTGISDLSNQRVSFLVPTVIVSQESHVNKLQSMAKQSQDIIFCRRRLPSLPSLPLLF
jgi:hypothetical protein